MSTKNEGCPQKVEEALKRAAALIEENKAYRKLGSPTELAEVLENVKKFTESFGDLSTISEQLEQLKKFEEEVGTLEETRNVLERLVESALHESSRELAEMFGVDVSATIELMEKYQDPRQVASILSKLTEGKKKKKDDDDEDFDDDDLTDTDSDEDDEDDAIEESKAHNTQSILERLTNSQSAQEILEGSLVQEYDLIEEDISTQPDPDAITKAIFQRLMNK